MSSPALGQPGLAVIRKPGMTREQLKHCSTIVKDLKKHRDALAFLVPVDPVLLNIPDYPSVVAHPMDLSTVERKLNSVEYETTDDFISDINLIFSNCYLYNGVEAPVSKSAKNLQTAFERLLRRMPGEASEPEVVKESPKKTSAPPKPKKDSVKKEVKKEHKLIPLQLVTPQSTATAGLLDLDLIGDDADERRPKRDIHAPSKDILTGTSAKRARVGRWKTDPQLKFCHNILREFSKKQHAEFMFPFMEPVDYVKLQIPEYPRIISHPMDLGTIRAKLESDQYDNADEFRQDVDLVINNCFTFNPVGTPVRDMGVRMQTLFNRKWIGLPPPPTPTPSPSPPPADDVTVDSDSDVSEEEEDEEDEEESSDDQIAEMERYLKTLSAELETMKATKKKGKVEKKVPPKVMPQEKVEAKPAPKTPASPPRRSEPKRSIAKKARTLYTSSDDDVPTITFEQKKELSENINMLEQDKLGKVVKIIHDGMPHLRDNGGQEEIELDVDSLDPKTLYKLYQYVKKNLPKRKPSSKKRSDSQSSKKGSKSERRRHRGDEYSFSSGGGFSSGSESDSGSDDEQVHSASRRHASPFPKKEKSVSSSINRRSSKSPIYARDRSPVRAASPVEDRLAQAASTSTTKPTSKRRKSDASSPPPISPPSRKSAQQSWLSQSLTPKATMSFDVAALDLDATDSSSKKNASQSKEDNQKKSDEEITQLENMELWADFTRDIQPTKTSSPKQARESGAAVVDPVWEQFQKDMKAKKEKEQQLLEEQLRKEREAREENERRREDERRRIEQDKERKKEIAREAYLREQRRLDEIQKKRRDNMERLRELRDNANPHIDQALLMHEFEQSIRRDSRDRLRDHRMEMEPKRAAARDMISQIHQYALQDSSTLSTIGTPGAAYGAPPHSLPMTSPSA
ncbi:hypothetical protein BGZ98_001650, partial [Dissophora globulifera]